MLPTVLMVAEKPSIALSIATILSSRQMNTRRSFLEVHEFDGNFRGSNVRYKVTSVIGHVLSIDFPPKYQNWDTTNPFDLFDAPTIKSEANPKAHVSKHLQQEGRSCDYLVLWLDCDREGENICFEVMDIVVPVMRRTVRQQVFRARFSAISESDIRTAMSSLVEPNRNEALAVDARQEVDLKVGVAFTRFQTRFFQGKYGNLDSSVISYGPCQTPTLGFCVDRHIRITTFTPEPFWVVRPHGSKSGQQLMFEWDRGRVFDREVGVMFQKMVIDAGSLKVTAVSKKEERKVRPNGLNTVDMLKVASSALNMGPHHAMQIAERLYTQGYISYPRTESTSYPSSFDVRGALALQRNHPIWGDYAQSLIASGSYVPKAGVDAGDHPPITPMRCATEAELGGDAWRLYEYVTRHFLGSVSPDCKFMRTKVLLSAGGEKFSIAGRNVISPGFTSCMPWLAVSDENLPTFTVGESVKCGEIELHQGRTSPPDYLTESELISLMEKNGIGTDASIPVHINNICERNYAQVQSGRRVVPTALGITLIRGYQYIDVDLCLPDIRRFIEQQITLIAKGDADHAAVVQHSLQEFATKFKYFVSEIARMDALFEAQFSPLADSGRSLSKCGKCARYMKYISMRPSRLYCSACEEVYSLPQNGQIKLYKELTCPLDNFELVLFSLAGPDGKSYPLCPYCYNHPPFEVAGKVSGGLLTAKEPAGKAGGMPCTLCPHPTCRHSMVKQGVCACPECEGTLVLDPVSAPKWRLDCNKCSCLVYLPHNAHRIATTDERCDECGSTLLEVDFNKNTTPLKDKATLHKACVLCDDLLHSLIEMKHGKSFMRRPGGRGRGRGRGRGGRGRGRARGEDPKMSFRDF
ncbi:DNA topoisomerase III [Marchantia polymorpha subsp. ruderalis]|uniref:DNA topoisomerase n=2 Tax=Marchantia polymorpha TaxID=3197 RepID=A0AAF6ANI0_MARPO|nr:hypothetical protein MARPO_0014s0219 [Marchantia polymorpha]BBM98000.1 hypothetical protein Mp_1g10070 [Marchantia polymorpha subsp. ruderalis]|eukprot:PTQ45728.1 hypothetical protein MARPO_0014s0219 [Marchantia polymorpha]